MSLRRWRGRTGRAEPGNPFVPSLSAIVDIDGDDNEVSEDADVGVYVGLTAIATHQGYTVGMHLLDDAGGLFSINSTTGAVSVADALSAGEHDITVSAVSSDAVSITSRVFTITVLSAVPVNTVAPAISGTAQENELLSASTGTWSGSPTGFSYQWQVSDNGTTGWTDLATGPSYTVTSDEIHKFLRVGVTAINDSGSSDVAYSDATDQIGFEDGETGGFFAAGFFAPGAFAAGYFLGM
jgi:hypothetical protein